MGHHHQNSSNHHPPCNNKRAPPQPPPPPTSSTSLPWTSTTSSSQPSSPAVPPTPTIGDGVGTVLSSTTPWPQISSNTESSSSPLIEQNEHHHYGQRPGQMSRASSSASCTTLSTTHSSPATSVSEKMAINIQSANAHYNNKNSSSSSSHSSSASASSSARGGLGVPHIITTAPSSRNFLDPPSPATPRHQSLPPNYPPDANNADPSAIVLSRSTSVDYAALSLGRSISHSSLPTSPTSAAAAAAAAAAAVRDSSSYSVTTPNAPASIPFLANKPAPPGCTLTVDDSSSKEFVVKVTLPGFSMENIVVALKRHGSLHILADSYDSSSAHFERTVDLGPEAVGVVAKAHWDGGKLRVHVPRRKPPPASFIEAQGCRD